MERSGLPQSRTSRIAACCAVIGFALYWCAQFVIKPKLGDLSSMYSLLQLGIQVLTCVVVAFLHGIAKCRVHRRGIAWACGGLLGAGVVLSLVLPLVEFSAGPVVVTALFGGGFALLLLLWLEVLATQEPRMACIELPAAFLIGNVLTIFLSAWFTGEQNFLVGIVVVAGSLGALAACFRLSAQPTSQGSFCEPDRLSSLFKAMRPAFLGVAVFSFVYGIENELLVHFGSGSEVMSATSLLITAALLGSLLVYAFIVQKPVRLDILFSVLLPIMGLAVVLNPLVWESASWITDALVKSCFLFYQCAFWMACMYAWSRKGSFPYVFFALAAGCVWTFSFLGMLAGYALSAIDIKVFALVTGASLLVLWLCMMGGMFFFRLVRGEGLRTTLDAALVSDDAVNAVQEDGFEKRVERMVERYGLSPRETEVFQDFIKGRSAPYIAESLCISEYTVKTHLQHIYAKADVHNRQELLTLFEEGDAQVF